MLSTVHHWSNIWNVLYVQYSTQTLLNTISNLKDVACQGLGELTGLVGERDFSIGWGAAV